MPEARQFTRGYSSTKTERRGEVEKKPRWLGDNVLEKGEEAVGGKGNARHGGEGGHKKKPPGSKRQKGAQLPIVGGPGGGLVLGEKKKKDEPWKPITHLPGIDS